MDHSEETKKRILEAALRLFHEKGLRFTMDDIASDLSISKKTIYRIFQDKEALFCEVADECFRSIKESERAVLEAPDLDTPTRLRKLLGVMPTPYQDLDLKQLYVLKDRYPAIYAHVAEHLETGWEPTIALIEQGIREGVFRPVSIPVFKTMMEATLEQFFSRDTLVVNEISYTQALQEVVSILVDGIIS